MPTSTVAEFLGLTPAEQSLTELKAHFTALLKPLRQEKGLTQSQLAELMGTSQQSIARAESASPSVSLEFVIRALFTLDLSLADIGEELCALHNTHPPQTRA